MTAKATLQEAEAFRRWLLAAAQPRCMVAHTVGRSHWKRDDDGTQGRNHRGRVTGWRSDACEIRSHPKGVMAHSPGAGNLEECL